MENVELSRKRWQVATARADWRANALATWRLGERWTTTLGARYSGKQFNTLDNSDTNRLTFTCTSNFLVFDARVRRWIGERWSASLGIDNLGNEEYWAFHPYTQRTFAAEVPPVSDARLEKGM